MKIRNRSELSFATARRSPMPAPALKRVNSISDIKKRAQCEERRLSDGGERTVVTVPVAIAPTVQAVVAALSEASALSRWVLM